jgi:phosphoglycerate dehydrogenase-like enzyme
MRVLALEIRSIDPGLAEEIYSPRDLHSLLEKCDYVVVCLPLTPETRGMLAEKEFRSLKPSAYFVNVARGPIVDEEALAKALREGWIAGAGLDVFTVEPLPPSSPLWELPNIVIYPHIAGEREDYHQLAIELFGKNLHRYLAGRELFNLIDKEKGYNAGPLVLND